MLESYSYGFFYHGKKWESLITGTSYVRNIQRLNGVFSQRDSLSYLSFFAFDGATLYVSSIRHLECM